MEFNNQEERPSIVLTNATLKDMWVTAEKVKEICKKTQPCDLVVKDEGVIVSFEDTVQLVMFAEQLNDEYLERRLDKFNQED